MTRICLLGNSHAACIKMAWDKLAAQYPDVHITFFAARGNRLGALRVKNGCLVPATISLRETIKWTSGGLSTIDFRDYDVVLLVGLCWLYPPSPGRFSRAAIRQAQADHLEVKPFCLDLIRRIRELSQIPIFMAHQPFMKSQWEMRRFNKIKKLRSKNSGIFPKITDLFFKKIPETVRLIRITHLNPLFRRSNPYNELIQIFNETFLKDLDVNILQQPKLTVDDFYTRPEYAMGAKRLDIGVEEDLKLRADDRSHMNELFGEIFLRTHLPTLTARAVSARKAA